MTRILRIGLLAEGETELGDSIPFVKPQDGGKPIVREKEGALHTLIRRELSLAGLGECEFIQRRPSSQELRKGQVTRGYSIAHKKYVAKTVLAWSTNNDVDLILILIDSDDDIEKRRQEMGVALASVQASHFLNEEMLIENQHAGGLAIRNFETWLLADPSSIQTLFGVSLENTIEVLENLPSDSNDPLFSKNIFDSIIERSNYNIELSPNKRGMIARWELAQIINLDAIKSQCPEGYNAFISDIVVAARIAKRVIDEE